MNTFKNTIKENFTALPNNVANDPHISWKAKGIFLYLASKPQGWDFYMDEIEQNSTDGKTALQSGIKELEKYGYLSRKRKYTDGKISGWEWVLKIPDKTLQTENLVTSKPSQKESSSYNKKENNKKENNKKDNNKKELSKNSGLKSALPQCSEFGDEATRVAKHLLEAIKDWDETHRYHHKKPNLKSWIKEIELAMRKEGRTEKQFHLLIDQLYNADTHFPETAEFWAGNIESGKKLRIQFDKVKNSMKREGRHSRKPSKLSQQLKAFE